MKSLPFVANSGDAAGVPGTNWDGFLVNGGVAIYEMRALAGLEWKDEDVTTVGGYVVRRLGRLPRVGEQLRIDRYIVRWSKPTIAGFSNLVSIGDELHHFGWNACSTALCPYAPQRHVCNLRKRKHEPAIDLGRKHQMVLELRPSHDPTRTLGFAGVVVSLKDLSASVWLWKRDNGHWGATKAIELPTEPPDSDGAPRPPPAVNFLAISV